MDDIREHRLEGLTLRIDRSLCVGFGDCVALAPALFELDDEDIVVLRRPGGVALETLVAACDACPVDALSVADGSGRTLCPRPPSPPHSLDKNTE